MKRAKKRGHRSNKRGTLRLDIRTPIGRIARASGTSHLPTLKEIATMIIEFGTQIPLQTEFLRAIRDGRLTPLEVYSAHVSKSMDRLPTVETSASLNKALEEWLRRSLKSDKHKASHRTAINHVAKSSRAGATISDLPDIARKIRNTLESEGKAAQFNRVRSSLQAFLRDTVTKRHELYKSVQAIAPLEEMKRRRNNPQPVGQVMELARNISVEHVPALWGMALTGMGPSEFYGSWNIEGAGLRVHGTKRKSRDRLVPLVLGERFAGATGARSLTGAHRARKFAHALKRASGGAVQPYDLRRTYANWMEKAQIPRTRRRQYMGHSIGDVTEIYEQHEVEQYLTDDAAKLEALVKAGEKETLKVEVRKA